MAELWYTKCAMKRIFLFVVTNFAVMLVMMVAFHVLCAVMGVNPNAAFSGSGLDLTSLAIFSLIFGMGGSIISLLLSKTIAKLSVGARVVNGTEGEAERWLVETVRSLAERANVKMPEVAIYEGEANAFATGAFRNHALVAVSTKIMEQMTREELRAVLGHEMSHVANGDMVTTTLVQGVLNACVIFLSRLVAAVAPALREEVMGRMTEGSNVLFDLSNMVHIDSSGLGVLVQVLQKAKAGGGKVVLAALQPGPLTQGNGHQRQASVPFRHASLHRGPRGGAGAPPARHLIPAGRGM